MTAPGTAPPRDPALGLLDRLVAEALDPAYARAASRRQHAPGTDERPATDPRWRRHWLAVLGLALMVAVITLAAVQQRAAAPQTAARKQDLAAAIGTATASVDALEEQVRATTADVAALQSGSLGSDAEGRRVQTELDRLGPPAGTAEVTGPGLVITLDDAPPGNGTDPELGRVVDRDLQHVVNGLWQAGAEAVDINGQRLTTLSAIRAAGDAILVNYRPLVRPYVVTAVGDPQTLGPAFASGPAGTEIDTLHQTYGIRYDVADRDQVTVPAEPVTQLRYAKEIRR